MEAIKGVLQKLSEALAQLQQLTELATDKITQAKKSQAEGLQRLSDVEAREKAATLKEGRIRSAEKLDQEQNALLTAQSDLENSRKGFNKVCSARQAVLDQKEADLESGLKELGSLRKALEEEKTTYKQTLLAKMGG